MTILKPQLLIPILLATSAPLFAQTETSRPAPGVHQTIRHHKVAVEDSEATAAPELDKAEVAMEKQDFATAEPLLRQALTKDPSSFRAWYDLGFLYDASNRAAEAISAYRKAVAAKPDIFEANLHLGLALAAKADRDAADDVQAEQFLRAATLLKPESKPAQNLARAWIALGRLLQTRDPKAALEAFQNASVYDPAQTAPYLLAAQILEKQGNTAAAEQQYQSALKADPNSSDALIGLANLYMRGQRLGDAENGLRRYLAQHPDNGPAHLQLARVLAAQSAAEKEKEQALAAQTPKPLFALGGDSKKTHPATPAEIKAEQAATEFEMGRKYSSPTNAILDSSAAQAPATAELAATYIAAGKLPEAEALYREQLTASPQDANLHHRLGIVLLKQKRFADAQAELLTAVNLKPDLGLAYGDLASAAAENQQYALALQAMDARAKYLPEIPIGYFLRASCLDHLHQRKEAAAAYHRFLETANGQYPDQEWAARHRILTLEPKK